MKRLPISKISIKGYKSIQALDGLALGNLNILIGPNGAGKSNFISFFGMLADLFAQRLQLWTAKQGGADRILSFGVKETAQLAFSYWLGQVGFFDVVLEPTVEGGFVFAKEHYVLVKKLTGLTDSFSLGVGHRESQANTIQTMPALQDDAVYRTGCWKWTIFHFHDTSDRSGVKRWGASHDNGSLHPDAFNLAAFLLRLSREYPEIYQNIGKTVRLAVPFFDDFVFKTRELPTGEEQVWWLWKQKGSDYLLWPSQLSDGSIRFICLVTALLQPDPPSTLIIDEPELGLHPYALTLLGSLLRSASKRMQVIVSTQSVPLVNEFSIDDLIIVEWEEGSTRFKRYQEEAFASWLEAYSLGELWTKNLLGGRPHS